MDVIILRDVLSEVALFVLIDIVYSYIVLLLIKMII